jgi:ketosteroid isomerase-like protein
MPTIRFASFLTMTWWLAACGGGQPGAKGPPESATPVATASASAVAVPSADAPGPAPKPSLAYLMVQTLKGIGEGFNAHDAKKAASFYADDCTVANYGAHEARGRDEVARGLQRLFDAFSDAKTAPIRFWMKGNVAISEFVWAGTMTGDLMILKASNKPVGQLRVHVTWFNDDGLVKEEHDYGDQATLVAQMTGKRGAPPVPVIPTNGPDVHIATSTPDEDELVDRARGVDDLLSKGDAKGVMAHMASNADVWINFTGAPAVKGTRDLTQALGRWLRAFPDQKWTVSDSWGIDGFAITEHSMTGTQKGPLGPLAASNKPVVGWHWLDILQASADGKIQHGWGYANLLELQSQTGAITGAAW